MKLNKISSKYGWYLAKINASIENFKNIVMTSPETLKKYHLIPGNYIKITSLHRDCIKKRFSDTFILLPYFKELFHNYYLLKNIAQSITQASLNHIEKKYIKEIANLMQSFYPRKNQHKIVKLKEILKFDERREQNIKIAISESWLNKQSVDLGEIVLLRNDLPSLNIL